MLNLRLLACMVKQSVGTTTGLEAYIPKLLPCQHNGFSPTPDQGLPHHTLCPSAKPAWIRVDLACAGQDRGGSCGRRCG